MDVEIKMEINDLILSIKENIDMYVKSIIDVSYKTKDVDFVFKSSYLNKVKLEGIEVILIQNNGDILSFRVRVDNTDHKITSKIIETFLILEKN